MHPAVSLLFLGLLLAPAQALEMTFFAFDDHAIPLRHNLQVTLQQAEKHPANPVLRRGPPGAPDHGHALLYGSVLHIGGKFRMWYLGMSQREIIQGQAPGYWRPMCYAESTDGVNWIKPNLRLVEFNGSRDNNICLVEAEPFSLSRVDDFLSVLYEPEAPEAERYKCAYIAHLPFEEVRGGRSAIGPNEKRWCSTVCATSADGLSWKVVGDRPANAGGERFEVSGLYRFGEFYHITGQLISPWTWQPDGREVGRVMLTHRSPDFRTWSKASAFGFARPGQTLAQPVPGQQTHMGAGFWNRGNVLVGLYGMWQDGPKEKPKGASHLWGTRIDLGLVVSNDGLHFREPVPDFKIIARGGEDEWDNLALLQGHAFVNVGDRTYLWYSHWDCEGQFRHQEIGLATLRRDGFGFLATRHQEEEGSCITQSFDVTRGTPQVSLNIDGVDADAPLSVQWLDSWDRPLGEPARVERSGTRVEVNWPQPPQASKDGKAALRVSFPKASKTKLYAIYVDP
jgi:hypothetical protein